MAADLSIPLRVTRRRYMGLIRAGTRKFYQVVFGFMVITPIAHAEVPGEPAVSGQPVPDERVIKALTAAKLGYAIEKGDFLLDYKVDATRSQRVWVASSTSHLGPLELRDV